MKKIFIFCSWDGIYFREQANLLERDFEIKLIIFNSLSLKSIANLKSLFRFENKKSAENLNLHIVNYINLWFLPNFLQDIYENWIASKIKKNNNIDTNDLLFVNTIYHAGFWALIFNKKYGNKYIIDEHQQFILFNKTKRSIKLVSEVIKNAKKILVVSHDKARQMLTLGFQFEFEQIGNYVDEKVFYPSNAISNDNESFNIITIGAFSYLKDSETLFKILEVLDKNYNKKIKFTYIGYSSWHNIDNQQKVEALIQKYQYSSQITFELIPKASRTEVSEKLREANLFLLTSISEGMCVSLMEALATGLPVCTTQCGGVDELINQKNGKIFNIRDAESIADFITNVIDKKVQFDKTEIAHQLITEYGSFAFRNKLLKTIKEP